MNKEEFQREALRIADERNLLIGTSLIAYTVQFHNATGEVGVLDFNGDTMKFTGNADESAQVFLDSVGQTARRLLIGCVGWRNE